MCTNCKGGGAVWDFLESDLPALRVTLEYLSRLPLPQWEATPADENDHALVVRAPDWSVAYHLKQNIPNIYMAFRRELQNLNSSDLSRVAHLRDMYVKSQMPDNEPPPFDYSPEVQDEIMRDRWESNKTSEFLCFEDFRELAKEEQRRREPSATPPSEMAASGFMLPPTVIMAGPKHRVKKYAFIRGHQDDYLGGVPEGSTVEVLDHATERGLKILVVDCEYRRAIGTVGWVTTDAVEL